MFCVFCGVQIILCCGFGMFGVFLTLVMDAAVLLLLLREASGRKQIEHGLKEIAAGDLDYKIDLTELPGEDNLQLAGIVNSLGEGMKAAVQEQMKSERLKADLITNVSHDIKTPLTSIINYVDLLKRENIENEKAKDYIRVLDEKSQRLKQLTEDLVEASKISSGNIKLEFMNLNLNELVQQVNGEFAERFESRNLDLICILQPEPLLICADSRRIWRVLENLYVNVCKYAMPGTRVYVDAIKKDGKIKIGVFSDKNPFGYVDENGDVQGYDIYFGKRLAKDLLGSEDDAEFTYVEAASRVEYLQSAKVDVILANFTVTDDRAEKVDFALPYMKVALGVVSPDDALIKDVKDLEGKKLIVVKGTTAETYFTDNYPDIELVKFDEYQEAYDALLDGRGDAFSTDNTEVLAWAQQNEGFSVGIESLGDIDTIAPAVQKGNTDLLNAINDEIKSLADEQFFHKDFEETLKPVYGDNINPDDLVVEGGVVDSEEKAEDADAAETEDSDAASDDTKDAETTEEPEETEAADAE